jgi:predicted aspartyl protease
MSAADWREQRPTPSQRLHEVTMAALAKAPSVPEHTLELERDRNGNFLIRLAVRGPELPELVTNGAQTFDALCARYPRTNGGAE